MAKVTKMETPVNEEVDFSPNELAEFQQYLNQVAHLKPQTRSGLKFGYAVDRNLSRINSRLEAFRKRMPESPEELDKYKNERYKLGLKFGGKEQQGRNGSQIVDIKDMDGFLEAVEALDKKYEKTLKAVEEMDKKTLALGKEKLDDPFSWHKVDYRHIPADVSFGIRSALSFMINEPKEGELEEMFEEMELYTPEKDK